MQNLKLGSVAIGEGMVATQAWVSEGPIALILTKGRDGVEERSRLDLQKAMFIDPLPSRPSVEGVRLLISVVANALR